MLRLAGTRSELAAALPVTSPLRDHCDLSAAKLTQPVSEPSTVARGQTGYGPPLRGGPKLCRQCEGTCAVICQLVSVDYEVRRTQLVGLLGVHHLENLCLEGDVFVERDLAIAIRIDLAEHLPGLESMSKPGGRE
jgi:hypothetical protein